MDNLLNKPYFKVVLVVIGVLMLWAFLKPRYAPEMSVISFESGKPVTLSCEAKQKCVIAYLAPW